MEERTELWGWEGVKTAHLDILEDNKEGFVCSGVKTQIFKNSDFSYPAHKKDNKQ
jgi:hypothetical protein